ncbi:MAG TPA: helix-turn-helix transcriptional regulator [Vicinamibacterales bacterium]|nr:helix-turn-helix transcriptional regulator [Vicinamibacterales bacterium]
MIDAIYAAAVDPDQWPQTLGGIQKLLGGVLPALMFHDLHSQAGAISVVVGGDSSYFKDYNDYYGARNVWLRNGTRLLAAGSVRTSHMMCSRRELLDSEFFNDYLRRHGVSQGIGATILREGSSAFNITVMREIGSPDFAQREIRILSQLMPHLTRAAHVHRLLCRAEAERHNLVSALDSVTTAVVFVDAAARVLCANAAAERILRAADGLQAGKAGLEAGTPAQTKALRGLVTSVSRPDDDSAAGDLAPLRVERPSGAPPYVLAVLPMRSPASPFSDRRATAAVFVSDPSWVPLSAEVLARKGYSLTRAEARVAVRLLHGDSIEEAASVTGVTAHTARTHLKRILAKTGTRRQAELVALLLRSCTHDTDTSTLSTAPTRTAVASPRTPRDVRGAASGRPENDRR